MVSMLTRKANLRPIASPRRPKTTAPRGRTMNPAEKARRANTRSVLLSETGRKCWPMRGESAAKRLKSYQENAVPSVEAMITLRWAEVARGAIQFGPTTPVAIGSVPVPFGISLQQSARAYQGSVRHPPFRGASVLTSREPDLSCCLFAGGGHGSGGLAHQRPGTCHLQL